MCKIERVSYRCRHADHLIKYFCDTYHRKQGFGFCERVLTEKSDAGICGRCGAEELAELKKENEEHQQWLRDIAELVALRKECEKYDKEGEEVEGLEDEGKKYEL